MVEQWSSHREASRIRERRIPAIRYAIEIEQRESSLGACVPDLPGCVAVGVTEEEICKLITDPIALHVDEMRETGEAIPKPHLYVGYLDVRSAE